LPHSLLSPWILLIFLLHVYSSSMPPPPSPPPNSSSSFSLSSCTHLLPQPPTPLACQSDLATSRPAPTSPSAALPRAHRLNLHRIHQDAQEKNYSKKSQIKWCQI
jgi:hypothetical protein